MPEDRKSLIAVVSHLWFLKRYMYACAASEGGNFGRGSEAPAEHDNVILHAVAYLERKLLQNSPILRVGGERPWATTVVDAMHPSWRCYVRGVVGVWVHVADQMRAEAEEGGARENADQLLAMLDQALVHMLKLRPKSARRPGLEVVPEVLSQLPASEEEIESRFPKAAEYIRARALTVYR